jgi:hypothetical protein
MNLKNLIILFVGIVSISFSGCDTTSIAVSNADVDLYVNGVYKGKGHVEVPRTGLPRKMSIEAKYQGSSVGQLVVKRKFDALTLLACYYGFGVGMLFAFRYPNNVFVPISMSDSNGSNESIWKKPPGKWK